MRLFTIDTTLLSGVYSINKDIKHIVPSPLATKPTSRYFTYPRMHFSPKGKIPIKSKPTTPNADESLDEFDETNGGRIPEELDRNLESRPCTRETCSMQGECVIENNVVQCQCDHGYSGRSCEVGLQPLAAPLAIGTITVFLVFGVAAGVFVYVSRRKALQRFV